MMTSIIDLPLEILYKNILIYISDIELRELQYINKFFYNLCRDDFIWKYRFIHKYQYYPNCLENINWYIHYQKHRNAIKIPLLENGDVILYFWLLIFNKTIDIEVIKSQISERTFNPKCESSKLNKNNIVIAFTNKYCQFIYSINLGTSFINNSRWDLDLIDRAIIISGNTKDITKTTFHNEVFNSKSKIPLYITWTHFGIWVQDISKGSNFNLNESSYGHLIYILYSLDIDPNCSIPKINKYVKQIKYKLLTRDHDLLYINTPEKLDYYLKWCNRTNRGNEVELIQIIWNRLDEIYHVYIEYNCKENKSD